MKGEAWRLTHPGVVISVTGSAAPSLSESLPINILGAIHRGLAGAARATKAWIVTGGTRTGVMELVGNIMSQEVSTREVTVLGCSTCVPQAPKRLPANVRHVRHSTPMMQLKDRRNQAPLLIAAGLARCADMKSSRRPRKLKYHPSMCIYNIYSISVAT